MPIIVQEPALPALPTAPTSHPMTTRAKARVRKPKQIFSLHTKSIYPLPKSHIQALSDPNWTPSMTDEYDAMTKTRPWSLVPRPPKVNIVRSMWLYRLQKAITRGISPG